MTSFDPTRTAVVAVHLQNDVVGTDGAFAGFFRAEIDRTGVLATISRVLDGARSAGAKVVYTRVAWQPGFPTCTPTRPCSASSRRPSAWRTAATGRRSPTS